MRQNKPTTLHKDLKINQIIANSSEFEGNFCFGSKCFQIKSETEKVNRLINVLEEDPNVILVASWNFKSNKFDNIINEYGKRLLTQYGIT